MAAKLNRLILQLQAEKIISGNAAAPAGPAPHAAADGRGEGKTRLLRAPAEGRDEARAAAEAPQEARARLLHLPARRRANG